MSTPLTPPSPRRISLSLTHLQRVRQRLLRERPANRIEFAVWEAVLTLWILGWTGWLPAFALVAPWAFPLCVLGMLVPRLYVRARARAHDAGRLRCDWLDQLR